MTGYVLPTKHPHFTKKETCDFRSFSMPKFCTFFSFTRFCLTCFPPLSWVCTRFFFHGFFPTSHLGGGFKYIYIIYILYILYILYIYYIFVFSPFIPGEMITFRRLHIFPNGLVQHGSTTNYSRSSSTKKTILL